MKKNVYIIILLSMICSLQLFAQDSTLSVKTKYKIGYVDEERKWMIELPIWIPGFRGDFAYGEIGIEGEDGVIPDPEHPIEKPGFGDAFKRLFRTRFDLNYFLLFGITYDDERFYGEIDAFTGSLGSSLLFRTNDYKLVSASINVDLAHLKLGYNIFERPVRSGNGKYQLYALTGVRLHSFYIKAGNHDIKTYMHISPLWIEPIAGLKNELAFKNWKFNLQGDIGSFWINDKLSYQIQMGANYRISNLVAVKIGWNSWYIYYRDKFKNEDLLIKTYLTGPATSISFSF